MCDWMRRLVLATWDDTMTHLVHGAEDLADLPIGKEGACPTALDDHVFPGYTSLGVHGTSGPNSDQRTSAILVQLLFI